MNDIIDDAKQEYEPKEDKKEVLGKCPRCGQVIIERAKSFSCVNESCKFAIWKEDKFFTEKKKCLNKEQVKQLLEKGKVLVKGLYSARKDSTYDAYVVLYDTGEYVNYKLEFIENENETIGSCPRCGYDVVEKAKSYSCTKEGCTFAIWKEDKFFTEKKQSLTKAQVKQLLEKGKVFVKDLYSARKDSIYDAYVVLDDTGEYVNYKLEFESTKNDNKD